MRSTTVDLVAQVISTDDNGFEKKTETKSTVFAEMTSVSGREFYRAVAAGIQTDAVFRIRSCDYADQRVLEHDGIRYAVVRTYDRTDDWTEITAAVMKEVTTADGDDQPA